LFYGGRSSVG